MSKYFLFTIKYHVDEFSFTEHNIVIASNLHEAETVASDIVRGWYGEDAEDANEYGFYERDEIIWKLESTYEVSDDFATTAKRLGIMMVFNQGHAEATE